MKQVYRLQAGHPIYAAISQYIAIGEGVGEYAYETYHGDLVVDAPGWTDLGISARDLIDSRNAIMDRHHRMHAN